MGSESQPPLDFCRRVQFVLRDVAVQELDGRVVHLVSSSVLCLGLMLDLVLLVTGNYRNFQTPDLRDRIPPEGEIRLVEAGSRTAWLRVAIRRR